MTEELAHFVGRLAPLMFSAKHELQPYKQAKAAHCDEPESLLAFNSYQSEVPIFDDL
jgi:hypothetical protein